MSTFNAVKTLSATIAALKSGEAKLRDMFTLDRTQAEQIALAATAVAATPAGYADIRLLLARMSWHAGVAGKAGNAPAWILRSSTSKGVTTISAADYVYNANKARNAAAPAPAAPATVVNVGTSGDADQSDADDTPAPAAPDAAATIAALQAQIAALHDELERERASHARTFKELEQARAMLAAIPATPARKAAPRPAAAANA